MSKQRRHCLVLPAPVTPFRCQDAVAKQTAKYALQEGVLGEVIAAVDEHNLHQGRFRHPNDGGGPAHGNEWLAIDALWYGQKRIAERSRK